MMDIKFKPGRIVSTIGVHSAIKENTDFAIFCELCLVRHLTGDWGEICSEDKKANDWALVNGERILSHYPLDIDPVSDNYGFPQGKIYIITERDRSATTILFPSEY